jgi:8-oxo-dGTP pyrophosphatase MutT (NUDIX family)
MYPNSWASWGGKFEKELGDVTPQDCAKREFWEETRIENEYMFRKAPVHVYEDERVLYYTFIGLFEHECTPDITVEGGLADYAWFGLNELPDPLMPEFKIMLEENMEELQSMMDGGDTGECQRVNGQPTPLHEDHPTSLKKRSFIDLFFGK